LSEKGDESTKVVSNELTDNKHSRVPQLGDDGFQKSCDKASNFPNSTRNFMSKKYALTREPSGTKRLSNDINKGAIKEID
jgi:hypothetical protein